MADLTHAEQIDTEEVERIFAQRLASGEPTQRRRSLKLLKDYIYEQSNKGLMEKESLGRLSVGLHYILWMQDKMTLQEELIDNIASLIDAFSSEQHSRNYIQVLFETLSKEWPMIDRWRMDKFLLLVRRLFRVIFIRLAVKNWEPDFVKTYLDLFESLLNERSQIFESLKYQCASVYLDELDNSAMSTQHRMNEETALSFLQLYIDLLCKQISDSYFQTICTEIFDTILHDYSEQLAEQQNRQAEIDQEEGPFLVFNYAKISSLLFDAGKRPEVNSKRRKRIYALCKKFDAASRGFDPCPIPDDTTIRKLVGKKRKKLTLCDLDGTS